MLAKQLGLDGKPVNGSNGANVGFEDKLWKAADKLRNNMDAAIKQIISDAIVSDRVIDVFAAAD